MAIKYPENTLYNSMSEVRSLIPRAKKSSVDVSKFKNLPQMPSQLQSGGTTPTSLSNLGNITTPYGGSTRYEKFHPGIDVANKIGTKIPSFSSGVVSNVGSDKAYGNYVELKDTMGNTQRYSHLLNAYVTPGQRIGKGTIIGAMGNTGNTYSLSGGTGSHLDFRIRDAYNKYINPNKYLGGIA